MYKAWVEDAPNEWIEVALEETKDDAIRGAVKRLILDYGMKGILDKEIRLTSPDGSPYLV